MGDEWGAVDVQVWEGRAHIQGHFRLLHEESVQPPHESRPHAALLAWTIEPLDDNQSMFDLIFRFGIHAEEKAASGLVADVGREVLSAIINVMAFLSAAPVQLVKFDGFRTALGADRERAILFSSQWADLRPPVVLNSNAMALIRADTKLQRVLSWFRKGLEERDPFDAVTHLFIALNLLAHMFPIPGLRSRRCKACGNIEEIQPGDGDRFVHVLCHHVQLSEDEARRLWDLRNRIFHGGADVTPVMRRELVEKRHVLAHAVVRASKRYLSLGPGDLPAEDIPVPFFSDALLDVEYTLGAHP